MYHDVVTEGREDDSGFPGRDAALYKVAIARFDQQVRAIADRVAGMNPLPCFTFDDGGVSAMEAAKILERYGFHGLFFVTTNYIGTPGFLDAAQIREVHARGHAIGSHSCSHPLRMGHCGRARLLDEWARSRSALEAILGSEVRSASVPGGDFAPAVAEAAARAGITHLFTSEPTTGVRHAFGLVLHGRFTIQRWTTTDTVCGLASGAWLPRAKQTMVWNAKKLTKRIGGEAYLKMRKLLLRHGDQVRWGDSRQG